MPAIPAFLEPVWFQGADAAAYRVWASKRDRIAMRLFAALAVVSLSIRLIIEWHLGPESVAGSTPFRLSAIGTMALLFAFTFHRGIESILHPALVAALTATTILIALGHARAPDEYPFAIPGAWIATFMLGILSLRPRLVVLVAVTALGLPMLTQPLTGHPLVPLPTLMALSVVSATLALAFSYAQEQHWRRAFRKDLELAAFHAEQRRIHEELAAAYRSLRDTQAQLVQAEKTVALGRLVASLAHRVNSPIGNVVTAASHIDGTAERFTETVQMGTIRRSDLAAFLTTVAENNRIVLDSSREIAGLVEMFKRLTDVGGERPQRVAVGELLDSLQGPLESLMPANVRLVVDAAPGLAVLAPWQVMETIVQELTRNAATHAFGLHRAGTVTVRARAAAGDLVELEVADDGEGIPRQHLDHVFDPFYTDGKIGGGAGLGLSIVHNAVVGPLNGTIAIASQEGLGTSVSIRLPAAPAAPSIGLSAPRRDAVLSARA